MYVIYIWMHVGTVLVELYVQDAVHGDYYILDILHSILLFV